jgi:uncharacterized peroxidase-related enzyme
MFISEPTLTAEIADAFEQERVEGGYVSNHSRLWAWRPKLDKRFTELREALAEATTLTFRERAILVTATAGRLGDSYCSLAWGTRLANVADEATAEAVLTGGASSEMSPRENALATWARRVVSTPNDTTESDVAALRASGLDEQEIFDATLFVALRLAFSTVNDALGARPDAQLAEAAPVAVRKAITFGREPMPAVG